MVKGFKLSQFIQAAQKKLVYEVANGKLALANKNATLATLIPYSEGIFKTLAEKSKELKEIPSLYNAIIKEIDKIHQNDAEQMNDSNIVLPVGKTLCRAFFGKHKISIVPNGAVKAFEQYDIAASRIQVNSPLIFLGEDYYGIAFSRKIDDDRDKEMIRDISRLSGYLTA